MCFSKLFVPHLDVATISTPYTGAATIKAVGSEGVNALVEFHQVNSVLSALLKNTLTAPALITSKQLLYTGWPLCPRSSQHLVRVSTANPSN